MRDLVLEILDLDPAAGTVVLSASYDGKRLSIVDGERELDAIRRLWAGLDDDHKRTFAETVGIAPKKRKKRSA